MIKNIICLSFALLISSVSCWWDGGHMLVAEIAKQEIVARSPDLFTKIERYITMLSPMCDARSQTFVTAASWADDIKDDSMSFWYNWHFFDKPENPSGIYIQLDADGLVNNSLVAVKRAVQELQRKYYNPIQNTYGISIQQAMFMRLLIHIVGDMHQPLHNANMFNQTYPTGDYGGNKEHITLLNGTSMILHSFFDSGALRLASFQRPLNKDNETALTAYGTAYRTQYPRSYFGDRVKINDTAVWTQESFDLAHTFIYPYVAKTNKVTQDFDNDAYKLIMKQITIGGYRLADILMNIFDPTYPKSQQTNAAAPAAAPAASTTASTAATVQPNNLRGAVTE